MKDIMKVVGLGALLFMLAYAMAEGCIEHHQNWQEINSEDDETRGKDG